MKFQKLYWFRKPDGNVVQFTEKDAWQPYAQYEPRWKLMGVSNGEIYREMTKGPRQALAILMAQRTQLINSKQTIPAKLERDIEKANLAFNKANNDAQRAEYAAAKGHLERPPRNTKVYMGDPELIEEMRNGGIQSKLSVD
jgi:hypothetical protein